LHIKTVEARHLHVEDDALEPFKRQGFDMVNELLAEAKVVASIPNERTSRFIELRKASSSSQLMVCACGSSKGGGEASCRNVL
jgi:hypothetical protein